MVSVLSIGGVQMEYEQLNHMINEIKITHKLHQKMMSQYCGELTPEQGKLLYLIQYEKMSQKEIAKLLRITEATLSVRIKRLLDSGWIERETDKDDKRVNSIVLSHKGEELMKTLEQQFHKYKTIMCKGISLEDYETVLRVIHQIQENIREEIE